MEMEEERDLGSESVFSEALEASNPRKKTYLGDPKGIQSILRMVIARAMKAADKEKDPDSRHRVIKKEIQYLADVFLGKYPRRFASLPGWNEAGMIDEFCAKWIGCSETDARGRMVHSMSRMFDDVLDIAKVAGEPGVLDEQLQFQVQAVVERYSLILVGIDPAFQAMMD